jgi:hypothetical protein
MHNFYIQYYWEAENWFSSKIDLENSGVELTIQVN